MQYAKIIYSYAVCLLLAGCGGGDKSLPAASATSSFSSVQSSSSQINLLPASLGDKLIGRSIAHITSTLATGTHRETGLLQVHYGSNGHWFGDSLLLASNSAVGTYTAVYDAANNTIQVTTLVSAPAAVEIVDTYTFVSASAGQWLQNYNKGAVRVEGSFTLETKAYPGYAPLSLAGRKASLTFVKTVTQLPQGTYIDSGTAFHLYPTASHFTTDLSNYGLPAGEGNYVYDRPALNVGRDTGFNVTFNAPYQIEYQFNNLTSGTFKENWNSGEILWEGNFVLNNIE